jgi:hypothetical protein
MNLGIIGVSDVLRTGGAVFLLTRKSRLAKFFGFLWLAGEVYSLTQKEAMAATGKVTGDSLLPLSGKVPAQSPTGDGLMVPKFNGLGVLLQGYSGR